MRKLALAMVVLLLLCSCQKHESMHETLEKVMEQYGATAVSVAVIEDGKVTLSDACGWAVQGERPMTADTKVRVASLTKTAIGMAALAMQEDGYINLQAPLGKYWGVHFDSSCEEIMTHTSGLPGAPAISGTETLRTLMQQNNTGEWCYSNVGFSVLGTTMELVSGMMLDDYLQMRFFKPLEIEASLFSGSLDEDSLAALYDDTGSLIYSCSDQMAIRKQESAGDGAECYAGGLTISAPDFAKLICVLINDGMSGDARLLSEKSMQDMKQPRLLVNEKPSFEQCLVLRLSHNLFSRDSLYWHSGYNYGVNSFYCWDPENGNGVVVITIGADNNELGLNRACSAVVEAVYERQERS